MFNEQPLDADDHHQTPPADPALDEREQLREKYLKPGFGFWMSGVWCLLYLFVSQIVVGVGVSVIGVIILMVMAPPQGGDAMTPEKLNADPNMIAIMIAAMIGAHLAGILFSTLMLRWMVGKHWKRRICLTRLPSLTHCAIILIAFPALLSLIGLIQEPIMKFVPSLKDMVDLPGLDEFMKSLPTWPLFVAIFAVAVLPGIGEELWCRGFLANGTAARYGFVTSVLITSFFFGAIHIEPPQALLAMLIGVVIHSVYILTRSLLACIFMHFANNALVVLHEGKWARILTPIEEVGAQSPVLLGVTAALLFVAAAVALYQTRARRVSTVPGLPPWEPKGVDGVDLPPPEGYTRVAHDPISGRNAMFVLGAAIAFGLVLAFA